MKLTTRALTFGVALSLAPALGLTQTAAGSSAGAAQGPVRSLIEQGQFWQQRGRSDRAAEAWQKLLRIVPDQPDALIGMVQVGLAEGKNSSAREYLDRLKAAQPRDTRIAGLEAQVSQASPAKQGQLEEARNLARAGKADEAAQRYRSVTGGQVPSDPRLAMEYYQTLGGSKNGWQEGYTGLQRLARENPDDVQVTLALAEHMTYQAGTRRAGIDALARLADKPELSKRARESWRRALGWLGTGPADAAPYQAWLKLVPDDTAIRDRLALISQRSQAQGQLDAQGQAAVAAGRNVASAFQSLDQGDLSAARARFEALLQKSPNDATALGGLGLIELRERRYAEAESLLARASRSQGSRWREALDSARFWNLFEQAKVAREAAQTDAALSLLRSATKLQPREPAGQQALADVLVEAGRLDEAKALYQRILKQRPQDVDAVRGLMGVLAQQDQTDQALALAATLSPAQREQLGPLGRVRAERYRRMAAEALRQGDGAAAGAALEEALHNDPSNVWVRLDLAKLLQRDGRNAEATGLIDGLLMSEPDLPDALHAKALLAAERNDWPTALDALQAIRPEARSREMSGLYTRAWVRQQVDRAAELSRARQPAAALALLQQVEPHVAGDVDLLSAVAAGYADAGDSPRSLALIRSLMARSGKPDTALTLRYAGILQASKQQVELLGVLRQLQGMPMDAVQRQGYESLRDGYQLSQADSLREAGDLEAAYERIAPLLAQRPDHPAANAALARLHASAGQHAEALAVYEPLLVQTPGDADLILSAGGAALGARQLDRAQTLAEAGVSLRPQDSRMLSQAARVARARGDTREAERLLRAAIAAEDAARSAAAALPRGASPAGQAGGLSTATNPFAGITGKRTAGSPALAALPGSATFSAGGPAYALPGNPLPASATAAMPAAPVLPSARPAPAILYYNPPAVSSPALADPPSAGAKTSNSNAGASSSKTKASRRSKSARGTAATASPAVPKAALSEGTGYLAASADPSAIDAARWPALPAAAAAPAPVAARAPSFGEVLISPLPRNPRSTALPNAAPTLRDELAELQQVRATTVQVGSQFRRRSGEQGLGALSEFKLPIEAQTQVGEGRISVQVVPTVIDAGPPDPGYNTLSRFGGGPAVSLGNSGTPGSQGDQGVALGLGYTVDGLDLRLGTTPLGFRYEDVVGSASWRGTLGDGGARLTAQVTRRQLDDSVLTMAGARDVRTSQAWGGMMATGLRMDLAADEGAYEVYGWAAFDRISGHEVADNQKFELGGGLNYRLIGTQTEQLIAGVRLTVLGYEKNQRFFTFGHGGYFSPQSFASLAVPVEWRLSQGKTRYELGGAIGLQAFKESSADYFPDDAVRQAAAVRAATRAVQLGLTDVSPTAVYAGQSKLGLSYELHGRIAYQLSPRLQLIGALGFDNARDYQQFSGGVSLRYAWSGVDTAPVPLLRGFPSTVR